MKIYTKFGDGGQTYLASGKKVSKTDRRVDLYGTCDELNSTIGLALALSQKASLEKAFLDHLQMIQSFLFEIGSELAGYVPKESKDGTVVQALDVDGLEKEIDRLVSSLPEIKFFILPGGTEMASTLHIARTICRRLERDLLVYIESGGEIHNDLRIYINRLSDYLFVAARFVNLSLGHEETIWKSRTKSN
ncbi:cob(I)yrinic acid a,c-diamide adenosyltransferase [Leptospira biflexa]|uniref:cob(I)yrinic acid a,c-diamide adenosyltransferase n=1 Tax=Leptospira biflexa TaxID=172 RepID=UPI0010837A24|nr:cob(I)yrinic acid a,c-diamide adenosyltransferase [Leptospira biflexa]TGM36746.1 cob(I)yrinic acid a,c-diamide adenosyltransferase [Leptospira biflexa]TGM39730.1 cob(I)yrinic acid a,c-diamide adenosyltransferase [Leptospira biflexa]TGM48676.1 cob(I)yrinic acid a,c-diamide adenosyltransferase [Leptospira biflexa]TGM48856.1 cob(I)yrinic acid a,c-diamide adenosyltransferase [Leptospira biflexa]